VRLLDKTEAGERPIRLLGVSLHNFCDEQEPPPEREPAPDRLPFEDTDD
jgi:hypothetical protein